MSILRKRVKHYGKLPSSTIRDERLKDGSIGLLLRIMDLPQDWVVRADNMAANRPQGRDATAAELRNLKECGYYRVERRKMLNGRFQMGNAVSEESVPQWEAEHLEFGGDPIPLIEQPDGTFKVRRKNGITTDDGFIGEYAPGVNDLPRPDELPGRTGNGKSGTGKNDLGARLPETDISGHGFSGTKVPATGFGSPISTTEKYSREVHTVAGAGDQLSLSDDEIDLRAVGAPTTVTREREAPTAKRKDPVGAEAWRTAGLLPRRYRDGLPREYTFPMVHAIREAFYIGLEAPAVLRYAQMCAGNAEYAADKHLPLLRVALKLLAQDARMGLVCPACGTEPDDPFGAPCHRCRPEDPGPSEPTEADIAELERARAWLERDQGAGGPDDLDDPQVDDQVDDMPDDLGETFDAAAPRPSAAAHAPAGELADGDDDDTDSDDGDHGDDHNTAPARPGAAQTPRGGRGAPRGPGRAYSGPESDLRDARGSRDTRDVGGERDQVGGQAGRRGRGHAGAGGEPAT